MRMPKDNSIQYPDFYPFVHIHTFEDVGYHFIYAIAKDSQGHVTMSEMATVFVNEIADTSNQPQITWPQFSYPLKTSGKEAVGRVSSVLIGSRGVASIEMLDHGFGYNSTPQVTITSLTGTDFVGQAVMGPATTGPGLEVTEVDIIDPGQEYRVGDIVKFTGGLPTNYYSITAEAEASLGGSVTRGVFNFGGAPSYGILPNPTITHLGLLYLDLMLLSIVHDQLGNQQASYMTREGNKSENIFTVISSRSPTVHLLEEFVEGRPDIRPTDPYSQISIGHYPNVFHFGGEYYYLSSKEIV